MSKIAVVYWSATGNTEAMANAVAEGIKGNGNEAVVIPVDKFDAASVDDYDAIAFGCPAMGDEVLEEDEFQPVWDACREKLSGKKIALFGSYDWGEGDWMRSWEDDAKAAGAVLAAEGLICNLTPDADGEEACRRLGAAL